MVLGCQKSVGANTTQSGSESNLPVIKADNEHLQVNRNDGTTPLEYEISAGIGFVLDTSGYKIEIPPGLSITSPNRIQIIIDNDHKYFVGWEVGKTSYAFTAETLKPLQGSKPFSSFSSGQKVIIAIGYVDDNAQITGQVAFYPLWYAITNIK